MNTTRSLKVRVPVTAEIDPEAWALEYGMEGATLAEIRADIRVYIESTIDQHLTAMGVLA